MRAARGSPLPRLPLPWKSVGSDTGKGKRETGNVLRENVSGPQHTGTEECVTRFYLGPMRQLEQLDAWRVAQELAHMEKQRLDEGVEAEAQDTLLAEVLERALAAGTEAVERGPEQLDVLRNAGVVDAGAYGLIVIMAGLALLPRK